MSKTTNFDRLYELCGRLPEAYREQSRSRLWSAKTEGMTLEEADEAFDLRLREHGIPLEYPLLQTLAELDAVSDQGGES